MQIITDNLAMDQFMPPAQRNALNAAKHWMAEEWPRHFRLKPLARDHFLAPAVVLSGSNNNTSNPVHRREKHGVCCAVLCFAVPYLAVKHHLHVKETWYVLCCHAHPFLLYHARSLLCCCVLSCALLCFYAPTLLCFCNTTEQRLRASRVLH